MSEITTAGLDLAKNVFQAHGADASGQTILRKKLRRDQVLGFFAKLSPCVVAMEACGSSHFWGREIGKLGHEMWLILSAYVKPFVKRQKKDAADAEIACRAKKNGLARQHSTGGKQRLGATTRMGERSLRRLLIIGASSVIIKRHVHASAQPGTWLGRIVTHKPRMLVRVALADRMARIVWALMARGSVYKAPAVAA